MSNPLVDEAKEALEEADLDQECPRCGSKQLIGTWVREFLLDLETEQSDETLGSGSELSRLYCQCGWALDL